MPLPSLAPCVPLLAAGNEVALRSLLVQLVVIILAARVGAAVARRFRQPSVVGEIVAGLLLGPSAFGALFPEAFATVFRSAADGSGSAVLEASLTSFSQVGLVLLLFLVGIEFDFSHIRRQGRLAAAVSAAGVAVPFTLGAGLAWAMTPRLVALGAAAPIDPRSFALFLGTAMSITAIPILGRILIEMGLQHTRLGALVIAAAACDDAVGWTLLATVSAIARGSFEPASVLRMVAATLAFAACALFVFRPLVLPRLERAIDASGRLPTAALSLVLAVVLVAAWVTSQIGIFAIFGAFVLGAALSGSPRLREAVAAHFSDFVTVFFLPIFFTFTGLRTDIGSLAGPEAWGWCAAVFAVAVIGKWGGCGLAARLGGMPAGEAACVGVLMNTRALMELIVINVGMDLGVIPPAVYSMLVLMAIGTTLMATPLATRLLRGSPHERTLVDRGFLRAGLLIAAALVAPAAVAADPPLRVGVIGLDTSHAVAFTELLNDPGRKDHVPGARVVAAYPQGSRDIDSSVRRVPGHAATMRALGVEIVDSIPALIERVDAVLLESNDGRVHLEQAAPVLAAAKPLFIDKPCAGSLADIMAIYDIARLEGTPVFTSSALRYGAGTQAVRGGSIGRVTGCDTHSPCPLEPTHPDLFWYGIHGVESLFTVMGPGCETVVRTTTPGADLVTGVWGDGRIGSFRGLRDGKAGYGGTAFGATGTAAVGAFDGYRPLVLEIIRFLRTGESPVSDRESLEIYAFMEAADESKRQGGGRVALADVLARAREAAREKVRSFLPPDGAAAPPPGGPEVGLRAGAAVVDITPPLGDAIVGGFHPFPATHVHDDLHARCLVIARDDVRLAVVVCDLLGVHQSVSDEARRLIADRTGIPRERVLVSATHTHSATSVLGEFPAERYRPRLDSLDPYQAFVARRIADGVQRAAALVGPAELAAGSVDVPEHLFNRRWFMRPGSMPENPFGSAADLVKMNPPAGSPNLDRPAGPVDPTLSFVFLREPGGRPIAAFAAYSLHYVGGVEPGHVSADYFAIVCDELAARLGAARQQPPFVALLANGTSGDVNNIDFLRPRPRRLPYEQMGAVAGDVAAKLHAALAATAFTRDVGLAAAYRELDVPARLPSEAELAWARGVLATPAGGAGPKPLARIYAERVLALAEQPATMPVPLQVLRIGPATVGAMPCEVFAEIGLEFRRRVAGSPAFLVSLAHGYYGYLPTPRQIDLGGYETWPGTNRLARDASERMLAAVEEMASGLDSAAQSPAGASAREARPAQAAVPAAAQPPAALPGR